MRPTMTEVVQRPAHAIEEFRLVPQRVPRRILIELQTLAVDRQVVQIELQPVARRLLVPDPKPVQLEARLAMPLR